jgi:hypothetical protein
MPDPIQEEYRAKMNAVMEALDDVFNGPAKGTARQTGVILLTFKFGEQAGRCNYISNGADRKDMIAMFKYLIARWEGQALSEPGHA